MSTEKEYIIEILNNGIIQLLIQTVYFDEDGEELTRKNWRTTLQPGEFKLAKELLPSDKMAIIEATWSDEVVDTYQAKMMKLQDLEK